MYKLCDNRFQFDKSRETSRIIQPRLEAEDTLENPDIPRQVPKVQGLPLKCAAAESLRQKDRMQNRYPQLFECLIPGSGTYIYTVIFFGAANDSW